MPWPTLLKKPLDAGEYLLSHNLLKYGEEGFSSGGITSNKKKELAFGKRSFLKESIAVRASVFPQTWNCHLGPTAGRPVTAAMIVVNNENSLVWFRIRLFSDKPRRIGPKAIS